MTTREYNPEVFNFEAQHFQMWRIRKEYVETKIFIFSPKHISTSKKSHRTTSSDPNEIFDINKAFISLSRSFDNISWSTILLATNWTSAISGNKSSNYLLDSYPHQVLGRCFRKLTPSRLEPKHTWLPGIIVHVTPLMVFPQVISHHKRGTLQFPVTYINYQVRCPDISPSSTKCLDNNQEHIESLSWY